jgi:murein DD-endopeptidase MepM/ murein hydrolase activator NlpD
MRSLPSRRTASHAARAVLVVAALLATCLPAAVAADPTPTPTPSPTATPSPTPSASAGEHQLTPKQARAARARAAKARAEAAKARAEAAKARAEAGAKMAEAKRQQAEEDAHDAAALVAASAALTKAKADLVVAKDALLTAQTELTAAKDADRAAEVELEAAVLAEQRATRDLAVVEARIRVRQQDLGRLARSAYQSSGPMGEWAVVLSSTTPNQLADRLAFLQSVGTAGNAMIARLKEDRAALVNAQASLGAARRRQELARAAAAASLAAVVSKTQVAKAAAQQVTAVVAARAAAFEQAKKAALEDKRQYQVMVAQSGALAGRIVDLAAKLAKGKNPPRGTGEMVRPGLGPVTSPYGPRFHPILHYVKVHTGIDFGAADGIVYAADDGVVLFTEYNVAYGNMTVIDHGKVGGLRMTTLYAHQAAVGVKPGDHVVKGQAIGVIGSTGYATGPHLHFEVRIDGEPLDPAPFLEKAELPTALPTPAGARG